MEHMMKTIVYIGSYSPDSGEGIYSFLWEHDRLTPICEPVKIHNPSYLTMSRNGKYLYAVLESQMHEGTVGGGVAAFSVRGDGILEPVNTQPTNGFDPCHLCADSKNEWLITANYGSGSLSVFPLGNNGAICPHSSVTVHSGCGPVKERQSEPHTHFVGFTPDEKYVYASDLGTDTVRFYRLDKGNGTLVPAENLDIKLKPGSGPRHVVFRENAKIIYIVNELGSEIAVFQYTQGRFEPMQYISTLPSGYSGCSTAAALKMSADSRFLYASNRGDDSIAVYRVGSEGRLSLTGIYSTEGVSPRDFSIHPDENALLAANEKSDEVRVFHINRTTGALESAGIGAHIRSPVCVLFHVLNE